MASVEDLPLIIANHLYSWGFTCGKSSLYILCLNSFQAKPPGVFLLQNLKNCAILIVESVMRSGLSAIAGALGTADSFLYSPNKKVAACFCYRLGRMSFAVLTENLVQFFIMSAVSVSIALSFQY